MENQNNHSQDIFDNNHKGIVDDDDYDCKFRKVGDDGSCGECDVKHALETYHDTIQKCECMNDNVFQVQKLNNLSQEIQSPAPIRADDFQEPTKPHVKFKIGIEKKPKVPRTQSSQVSISLSKMNHSEVKININRVSSESSDRIKQNLSEQKEDLIRSQNYSAPQSNKHFFSNYQISGEKSTTNSNLNKHSRVKSSSILSFSSSNEIQQKKFIKCVPLRQFHVKQKDSFLQTAYRMRRLEQPKWTKNWSSTEKLKRQNVKMTLKPKDKIVFETYDFDGELIPSFYALQKQRKYAGEIPKVEFQFVNDIPAQNKTKNDEKKQTKAKTIKQAKIFQYPELIPVESQFLKNFKDLRWSQSIEEKFSHLQNTQGKRKLQQEEWISDFEKIKHSGSQKNQTSGYFQHSFSKYLKAKLLHEKSSKQKSRSLQDGKYLKMLMQDQNQKEPSIHQPIRVLKKGPQKVRANKMLFEKIFDTSLKNIDPQCREDIATIKLINETKDQNILAEDSTPRKKHFGNETNNFLNGKFQRKDLQKMFKKQTKKVIFKHSLLGGNRKSFQ